MFTRELKDVDRAVLDGEEEGFVKIMVKKDSDKILGATIVARHAGEMISEITTAMVARPGPGKPGKRHSPLSHPGRGHPSDRRPLQPHPPHPPDKRPVQPVPEMAALSCVH